MNKYFFKFMVLHQQIDFSVYGKQPVQTQLKILGKFSISNEHMILLEGKLRKNEIETEDDYF